MNGQNSSDFSFTHTRLLVPNYREYFHFYRHTLGFEVTLRTKEVGYADLRTGDTTLALFDRTAMAESVKADSKPVDADQQDEVAVIFEVSSVDEVYEQLQPEVEFVTRPHDQPDWGIRVAHFRDPAGTLLEINEPHE